MSRLRAPPKIDFSARALLGDSGAVSAARPAKPAAQLSASSRPFAAAVDVQAYLAKLQAKVKKDEASESSSSSEISLEDHHLVISGSSNESMKSRRMTSDGKKGGAMGSVVKTTTVQPKLAEQKVEMDQTSSGDSESISKSLDISQSVTAFLEDSIFSSHAADYLKFYVITLAIILS